mmetsp:Transcript_2999/g.6486  ORF Transcript_2999/g.6486 Transcript_2999/m.6486 type:complete len:671 (+) Transcript_2999:326-2338(+)
MRQDLGTGSASLRPARTRKVSDETKEIGDGGDDSWENVRFKSQKRVAPCIQGNEHFIIFLDFSQNSIPCIQNSFPVPEISHFVKCHECSFTGLFVRECKFIWTVIVIRLRPSHGIHHLRIGFHTNIHSISIVRLRSRLQQSLCFRKMRPDFLEHERIRLNVRPKLNGAELPSAHGLGLQASAGKDAFAISSQEPEEETVDFAHVAFVFVFDHRKTRVRHHKATDFFEAGMDLLASFFEIGGGSFRQNVFEVFGHFLFHGRNVGFVLRIKVLPITNQKVNPLEWFFAQRNLFDGIGTRFLRLVLRSFLRLDDAHSSSLLLRLERHPPILRKQRQLLQIILLNPLVHVINLVTAQQGAQPENRRRQADSRLVIEHPLRIHQQHGHVLPRRAGKEVGITPHPHPRGIPRGSSPPIERSFVLVESLDSLVPLLVGCLAVGARNRRPALLDAMPFQVPQEPTEQKTLAGAKGAHDGHDAHFPSRGNLGQDGIEFLLVEGECVGISGTSDGDYLAGGGDDDWRFGGFIGGGFFVGRSCSKNFGLVDRRHRGRFAWSFVCGFCLGGFAIVRHSVRIGFGDKVVGLIIVDGSVVVSFAVIILSAVIATLVVRDHDRIVQCRLFSLRRPLVQIVHLLFGCLESGGGGCGDVIGCRGCRWCGCEVLFGNDDGFVVVHGRG